MIGRKYRLAASSVLGALGIFLPASPSEAAPPSSTGSAVVAPAAAAASAAVTGASASGGEAGIASERVDAALIRPFRFQATDEALAEMRRRILATNWPERETVPDSSRGVPLATMQKLARYWASDYDWRKAEARLNSYPQFTTRIDGLDFHFIHVRSRHRNALPLIISHGWPGSILEQIKLIGPLTDPTAYGGAIFRRAPAGDLRHGPDPARFLCGGRMAARPQAHRHAGAALGL